MRWIPRHRFFGYGVHDYDIPRSEDAFVDVIELGANPGYTEPIFSPDVAIWQFCEKMYRSYPVGRSLLSCKKQIDAECAPQRQTFLPADLLARRHYRVFVYSWCFQNWARVRAMAAETVLLECINAEMTANTGILPRLAVQMAAHGRDECMMRGIGTVLANLLQADTTDVTKVGEKSFASEFSLIMLYMWASKWYGNAQWQVILPRGESVAPLDWHKAVELLAGSDRGWIASSMLFLGRTQPSPGDALRVLAEHLFRGRWPGVASSHILLPGLLLAFRKDPANEFVGQMLSSALAAIARALELLCTDQPVLRMMQQAKKFVGRAIDDLKANSRCLPTQFTELMSIVDLGEPYCEELEKFCHRTIGDLKSVLENYSGTTVRSVHVNVSGGLREDEIDYTPLLVPFDLLVRCCHNWGCLSLNSADTNAVSEQVLDVAAFRSNGVIVIRILGAALDMTDAIKALEGRRNWIEDKSNLLKYNVIVNVDDATDEEARSGFRSAVQLIVPEGFGKGKVNAV